MRTVRLIECGPSWGDGAPESFDTRPELKSPHLAPASDAILKPLYSFVRVRKRRSDDAVALDSPTDKRGSSRAARSRSRRAELPKEGSCDQECNPDLTAPQRAPCARRFCSFFLP